MEINNRSAGRQNARENNGGSIRQNWKTIDASQRERRLELKLKERLIQVWGREGELSCHVGLEERSLSDVLLCHVVSCLTVCRYTGLGSWRVFLLTHPSTISTITTTTRIETAITTTKIIATTIITMRGPRFCVGLWIDYPLGSAYHLQY